MERVIQRTATATIELRDGVVIARIHPGARQSIDNARENLRGAIEARQNRRRPILVDISGCEPLDPDVRRQYTGELLARSFSAIAMLVEESTFGRLIGNIYLRIAQLGVPARLFSSQDRALDWLHRYA
jgi:hypothetical protein